MMRLFFVIIQLLSASESANILGIFPIPFYSHLRYHENLVSALLDRGHTVTVLIEGTFKNHENLTQINFNASQAVIDFDIFSKTYKVFAYLQLFWVVFDSFYGPLENRKVQDLIRNDDNLHFDLIISETVFPMALNYLAEVFDCPIIASTALSASPYAYSVMGIDVNPAVALETAAFSYDVRSMTLLERLEVLISNIVGFTIIVPLFEMQVFMHRRKYFPQQTATLRQNEDRICLLISNTHPALGSVRPMVNTVQIGFFDLEPPKPIPNGDLKNFLYSSDRKVIVVSFGSIAKTSSLDPKIVKTFMRVFAQLDYSIVWKFQNTSDQPPNVFTTEWIPQFELLAHPKTELLITHGGLHSVYESIDRAVPMLAIPIFGDHFFNAENVRRKGLGVVLQFSELTEETLLRSVREALNPDFKTNLLKIRKLIYDQPVPSRELAVWWVEHVIEYKGLHHYEYPGREISFCRKYYIDLLFLLAIFIFVATKVQKFLCNSSLSLNKKVKTM